MNYNDILYSFCVRNNTDEVKRILECYNKTTDEIDVLDENGIFFKIAISKNNFKICEVLLSFFENKQNPSEEQKEKLRDMLEEVTSFSEISKEMQLVLKNYVPYEEDSREECFDEEDNINFQNWLDLNTNNSEAIGNLNDLKLIGDTQNDHHQISHEVL